MSDTNWQGQKGVSASCALNPGIVLSLLVSMDEHPCDRCNMDRMQCHGFPPTPSHAEKMAAPTEKDKP